MKSGEPYGLPTIWRRELGNTPITRVGSRLYNILEVCVSYRLRDSRHTRETLGEEKGTIALTRRHPWA